MVSKIDFFDDGRINDEVHERWMQHNPARFAAKMDLYSQPEIYFDCGSHDNIGFYPLNQDFADSLEELGLQFRFNSFDGSHSDRLHHQR